MSEESAAARPHADAIGYDDHPLPHRTLLVRNDPEERVEKIVEVTQRLRDIDGEHYEYVLQCPTHTASYQYHEADVEDCFLDTGATCNEPKPVMIDWVRKVVYDDK